MKYTEIPPQLRMVLENPQSFVRSSARSACAHMGATTGERVGCDTCAGNVQIKLVACEVHGNCTTHKKLEGVACCRGCKDYEAKPTEGDK